MNNFLTIIAENDLLKKKIRQLEDEVVFLKTHPAIANGIKGEQLIADLLDGTLTSYNANCDFVTGTNVKIEVKYSKLHYPAKGYKTTRWTWSKPLGWLDKGKEYDFLLLIGEKDERYVGNYLSDGPYVFFLLPQSDVNSVLCSGKIGSQINLSANFRGVRSKKSKKIISSQINYKKIAELLV